MPNGPIATVTEITALGFAYKLDYFLLLGTRIGSTVGGECYEAGFSTWTKTTPEDELASITPLPIPIVTTTA